MTLTALPAGNTVLLAVLRAAMSIADDHIVSLRPADYAQRLPLLHVRTAPGGGQDIDPRFMYRCDVLADAYAATAVAAEALADEARRVLVGAQLAQTVHAGGVLNRVLVTAWPAEMRDRDQTSGLARYHARYMITIRRQ